ncbi:uncharacterized protein BCR38DRAFT_407465 [Pseudomassariella vexata]|uniref:Uncharacterized protein n=1 Tax=Pseudomassariella vexata TaxID=1141098 RepID=A0A1Y2E7H2_9PEZI|nr:uncharacterized protein BCR38DRAFT_407465 [Pseudomassariella vexata]ORY67490.1 hypothetical protein BCR38DRAFT_407465 [Pseudomassariella vexata]
MDQKVTAVTPVDSHHRFLLDRIPNQYVWVVRGDSERKPVDSMEPELFVSNHYEILKLLRIHDLHKSSPAQGLYLEWSFDGEKHAWDFFLKLRADRDLLKFWDVNKTALLRRRSRLHLGLEWRSSRQSVDVAEQKLVSIQKAKIPISVVLTWTRSTITSVESSTQQDNYLVLKLFGRPLRVGEADEDRIHLMWPFFGCKSILGYKGGSCGNCLWQQDKPCCYATINKGDNGFDWKASYDPDQQVKIPDQKMVQESVVAPSP